VSTVVVTGNYTNPDGSYATGYVKFQPSTAVALTGTSTDSFLAADPLTIPLSNGSFTVTLVATDGTGVSPAGFTYTVTEMLNGATRTYSISVPKAVTPVDITVLGPP
jgi:hypothetical protein